MTTLIGGDDARALLEKPAFIAAWDALFAECRWATPFQSAQFATSWYAAYERTATPLFAIRGDPTGQMAALFPLAQSQDGRISVAGAEQAEYQGWLSRESDDDFLPDALSLLERQTVASSLLLKFVPPGAPLERLDSHSRWGQRLLRRTVSRNLMRTDAADVARSLKKSGNRSKLNRLRQLGNVRLERLTTRAALNAVIDEIAAYCDVRQCAVNGAMPFRDDSCKREFELRKIEHPGLLHATVLWVGDRIAAAHLGVASRRDVALGVIAHSPFLAAHSPGKLLILLLAEQLASDGFACIDLTPEGAYKDRFASDTDYVEIREIYLRRDAYVRAAVVSRGRQGAKRVARVTGQVLRLPEGQLEKTLGLGWRGITRAIAHSIRPHPISRPPAVFRRPSSPDQWWSKLGLVRDRVGDLSYHDAPGGSHPSRQALCSEALERLESGHHIYTRVEQDRLRQLAWSLETDDSEFIIVPAGFESATFEAAGLQRTDAVPTGATPRP